MKKIKGEKMKMSGIESSIQEEFMLPTFELNDNDVPEIKKFKVGEKIKMMIEVVPIRISSREDKEEEITTCKLEIKGVEVKRNETLNEKVESKEAKDPNRM
jgi:hypothetical protein